MYRGLHILLFLSILTACSDLKNDKSQPEFSMHCILQPNEPVKAKLSTTFNNHRHSTTPITSAIVAISETNGHTDTLKVNNLGQYESDFTFSRNTELFLNAYLKEGQMLVSSINIPSPLLIEIIEEMNISGVLTYRIKLTPETLSGQTLYLRHQAFAKDSATGNHALESIEYDPYFQESPFFTMNGSEELMLTIKSPVEVVHVFTLMSKEVYQYLKVKESFNPGSDDQITPIFPGNISGGIGIFGFYEEYIIK